MAIKSIPIVSIIMPTYNGANFIATSIQSVLDQSFENWELLIFDDESTDNTRIIIDAYAQKDPRIHILRTLQKKYTTGARNHCIKYAKWYYICLLDHDDTWLNSDKLKKQLDYMMAHLSIGVCGTNYQIIDQDGVNRWSKKLPKNDAEIKANILLYSPFVPCSVMIKKQLFDQYGYFDPLYDKVDDYEIWLRFGRYTDYYNLPEYLVGYRIHTDNTSFQWKNMWKMKWYDLQLTWKYRTDYPMTLKSIMLKLVVIIIPYEFLLKNVKMIEIIKLLSRV